MKQLPLLILAVLFAAAAVGGYVFMLIGIQTAVDSIASARADSDSADQRVALARTASQFMTATAADRAELSTFVATDSDFVSAINTIEAAGSREKLTATIGAVNVEDAGLKFHELADVSLSASGPFSNVVAFASALESLPIASQVKTISLEPADDGSWFGSFELDLVKTKPQQ